MELHYDKIYESNSAQETINKGKEFAEYLIEKFQKNDEVFVYFFGDLGYGKTTFISGILNNFGINLRILSPTFLVVKNYFSINKNINIYHIDLYRIGTTEKFKFENYIETNNENKKLYLVEWADYAPIEKNAIKVKFETNNLSGRKILITEK